MEFMKLKKINAVLSLVTILGLLVHLTNEMITYTLFIYNPVVSKVIGFSLMGLFLLHGGLAVTILFVSHDSHNIEYKKLNKRTVFQRATAGLVVILLPLHIISFDLMSKGPGPVVYVLLEVSRFLYYGSVLIHAGLSFGNALVTLGLLENRKKKRILDLIMLILSVVITIAFGIYITVCHLTMFNK